MNNFTKAGILTFLFSINASAENNSDILSKVWALGSTKACTLDMRAQFNSANFLKLNSQIKSQTNREELESILNPWLKGLGWSHTQFMAEDDEAYYFLKDFYATDGPETLPIPKLINPGVQLGHDSSGFFIREVLEGFSAKQAGIRKGDRILTWSSNSFNGSWGKSPSEGILQIDRNGKRRFIKLKTLALDWSEVFLDAMKNSVRIFNIKGKKIGYIHLWSLVHSSRSVPELQSIVSSLKPNIQGLILDIRGGYGGYWGNHLDPFFKNTSTYFEEENIESDGKVSIETFKFKINPDPYLGPLVVITNEGSRSGKEGLAYQFKKSHRAVLVGEKTAGYFVAAQAFFAKDSTDYILYLCVNRKTLDHNQIEGVGISPDIELPFKAIGSYGDNQIEKALDVLAQPKS